MELTLPPVTLTRYFLTGQAPTNVGVTSSIIVLGRTTPWRIGNILVVDDEEAIREVVSTMLESRGYQCTSVSNGRAAQEFVRKQTPDLVLSDMIMPEMDGIKLPGLAAAVRCGHPGHHGDRNPRYLTALKAIRRGAYDYILKPFEKDQLFHGVKRALDWRQVVRENKDYQQNLEQMVNAATGQYQEALAKLEQSYDDTLEALEALWT